MFPALWGLQFTKPMLRGDMDAGPGEAGLYFLASSLALELGAPRSSTLPALRVRALPGEVGRMEMQTPQAWCSVHPGLSC